MHPINDKKIVFACNSMEGKNVAHSQSVSQSVSQ